jgi:thioesterase domain-containing protein
MCCDKPIFGAFEAICSLADQGDWEKFIKILKRKGRSRIVLDSTLKSSKKIVGKFEGSFVAITI